MGIELAALEEYVVCALLHHIGDTLGSYNHPEVAAAILMPFVSEANLWMSEHHGIFQGHNFFHHVGLDRDMPDLFKGHSHYGRTVEFFDRYDSPAFDPEGEIHSFGTFEPMVQGLMAAQKRSLYRKAGNAL
jgi:predicted HD phosphohydrolase